MSQLNEKSMYFLSYEAKTSADVLKISMIYSTFTAICCLNAKDHRTCMGFAALGVLVAYPHHTEGFVATWIKAKVGQRDAETPESQLVQRTTLASAFETFNAEIRCVTDGLVVLTPQDRVDLLTLELEQYKKRWRSKVPMMSALKELCEAADLETSVRVIIRVFGDAEMSVHDEVPRILHKVLKMYEKDRGDAMNLAMLYFLHYTYCVKDTISKNADEMERSTCFVSQSNEPPDAIPRDPTEECDIVSSYESLRLDKYSCVMKYLSRSLNLFSSTITEDFHLEILPGPMLYDTLLKISHEYRLHRHRIRSLQALQTAVKVARSLNDPSRIVECIGFLVERSDVTKSYVRDLIATADELVAEIDQSDLRPAKIVMTYHMCKARAYLYHDPEAAFGIFRAASDLYEVREDKGELELVKCQLLLLHYRFVLMPCSLGLVDHGESTLLTVHAASAAVFEAYNKSNLGGPYEISVLLDANEELARLYHDLRSPREVRAYCRQTVLLAQKLVLPFRCASYLVYLAHADLRSTRLDDCQVKLNGLADILQLARRAVGADVHPEPPGGRGLEKDVETITGNLQEMVLDLPVPSHYRRQLSPSSPTLVVQPFRAPAFLRHAYCECLPCVSVEYQELVLEKVRLDALINEKQGSPEIARDLFLAALDLYERYVGRAESFKLKISSIIPPDLVPELKTEFLPALVGVLLNYSYHLMRGKSKADALKTSDKLLSLLTPRKVELGYLYAEALVQKLGYLADVPKITVSFVEADVEAVPHQTDLPKTPESKQSNVTVQRTPFFSPPERVPMKNIRIKLALDEDDASDERPQKPARRLPKTPAPKIQIYANDDPKAKTPLPIFADGKKSTKKRTATGNGVFVAPSTPVVVEPSGPKNDAALKSRTKLLTERLRQSSKKVGSESNSKDENGMKNEGRRPAVRKNLLSELGGRTRRGRARGRSRGRRGRGRCRVEAVFKAWL
ncbi:hypothetical protein NQ318_013847 [Aromia moschata]|uniref:Uncharacterized protein n=1 Tax=Aromia moschata TaxID=1265417 RepID=A0AAV8ZAF7_9CUCU|nr:hypothetical protein NQ318_013847 [Aromia moschata]